MGAAGCGPGRGTGRAGTGGAAAAAEAPASAVLGGCTGGRLRAFSISLEEAEEFGDGGWVIGTQSKGN